MYKLLTAAMGIALSQGMSLDSTIKTSLETADIDTNIANVLIQAATGTGLFPLPFRDGWTLIPNNTNADGCSMESDRGWKDGDY